MLLQFFIEKEEFYTIKAISCPSSRTIAAGQTKCLGEWIHVGWVKELNSGKLGKIYQNNYDWVTCKIGSLPDYERLEFNRNWGTVAGWEAVIAVHEVAAIVRQ